jgi:hypothetical protein
MIIKTNPANIIFPNGTLEEFTLNIFIRYDITHASYIIPKI